ncbi:MAG: ribonuclease D [Candidatus Nanopelagicales bacterium]
MSHELHWDAALPDVVDTAAELEQAARALRDGEGPLGVDAERAGSYRYSQRAYLVQVYRRNAPVLLLDPIGIDDFSPLAEMLGAEQWVMQAAHNDLDCLAEIGLVPPDLFDTEIAGQLLGLERVGLASLVETQLGYAMRKGHGQADWSRRPLRRSWLEYAVLDVSLLPDLEEELAEKLAEAGKTQWAREEFTHQMRQRPTPDRHLRWLRTNGAGKLRTNAQRGALRALWFHRDELASTTRCGGAPDRARPRPGGDGQGAAHHREPTRRLARHPPSRCGPGRQVAARDRTGGRRPGRPTGPARGPPATLFARVGEPRPGGSQAVDGPAGGAGSPRRRVAGVAADTADP